MSGLSNSSRLDMCHQSLQKDRGTDGCGTTGNGIGIAFAEPKYWQFEKDAGIKSNIISTSSSNLYTLEK